jgi:hypothetical protein
MIWLYIRTGNANIVAKHEAAEGCNNGTDNDLRCKLAWEVHSAATGFGKGHGRHDRTLICLIFWATN